MTIKRSAHDHTVWYRQFWLWVVIAFPTSAVIAGFVTLWLVLRSPNQDIASPHAREPVNDVVGRNSVAPPKQ